MNAFELFEKYNTYNTYSLKIKKLQSNLKGNKELDDCLDMLKDLQKEFTDKSQKIKESLENVTIEIESI